MNGYKAHILIEERIVSVFGVHYQCMFSIQFKLLELDRIQIQSDTT